MSRLLRQVHQLRQARQLHRVTLEVEGKFKPSPNFIHRLEANRGTPAFHSIKPLPQRAMEDTYFDHRGQLARNGLWVRMRNGQWQAKVRRGGDFVQSSFEEYGDVGEIRGFVGKYLHDRENQEIQGNQEDKMNQETGGGKEKEKKDRRGKEKIDITGPTFGLTKTAHFTTFRRSWLVNDIFNVVHDETSFGHCVGEVELEREVEFEVEVDDHDHDITTNTTQTHQNKSPIDQKTDRHNQMLQQKKAITAQMTAQMNADLTSFLTRHAWAFSPAESERESGSEEDQSLVPVGKLSAYFARYGYDDGDQDSSGDGRA